MSALETTAFGVLWLIAIILAALLLTLYRQVDKAYRHQDLESAGLLPGVEAPALDILTDSGIEPLELPTDGALTWIAFLTTTCDACTRLIPLLANDAVTDLPVIALMSGEKHSDTVIPTSARVHTHWLAHPPDAVKRYGAAVAPFVYVLRGRTVLASRSVSTESGLAKLLNEALEHEARLLTTARASGASTSAVTAASGR